jgi:hypothetical protein
LIYLGFVGSSESHWTKIQKQKAIQKIFEILTVAIMKYGQENIVFVSGGCKKGGIDIWAENVADAYGLKKHIFIPEIEQWDDYNQEMSGGEGWARPEIYQKGYKSRNMDIAKNIEILYCIDPKNRQGGGGLWTLRHAKKIGKETHHIEIE